MAEYIKREDAIEVAYNLVVDMAQSSLDWESLKMWVKERVQDDIPSADVVERKRGEWIELDECSICGKQAYDFVEGWLDGISYLPNFCPNCGADMREREGE